MRQYEMIFILRPDVVAEELDKLIAQMEGVVAGAGGRVAKVEKMGVRRLAYRVRRQREGIYVLFHIEGSGDTVREFERRLKVTDAVLKYISVRVDEALKRAEKQRAIRAKHDSRRPRLKTAPSPAPHAAAESAQT